MAVTPNAIERAAPPRARDASPRLGMRCFLASAGLHGVLLGAASLVVLERLWTADPSVAPLQVLVQAPAATRLSDADVRPAADALPTPPPGDGMAEAANPDLVRMNEAELLPTPDFGPDPRGEVDTDALLSRWSAPCGSCMGAGTGRIGLGRGGAGNGRRTGLVGTPGPARGGGSGFASAGSGAGDGRQAPIPRAPRRTAPDPLPDQSPPPRYPRRCRERNEQGTVVLRVRVDAGGEAAAVQVVRSSGFDSLDEAAADAVARWRFRPASEDDRPVAAEVDVPVVFRLE